MNVYLILYNYSCNEYSRKECGEKAWTEIKWSDEYLQFFLIQKDTLASLVS